MLHLNLSQETKRCYERRKKREREKGKFIELLKKKKNLRIT